MTTDRDQDKSKSSTDRSQWTAIGGVVGILALIFFVLIERCNALDSQLDRLDARLQRVEDRQGQQLILSNPTATPVRQTATPLPTSIGFSPTAAAPRSPTPAQDVAPAVRLNGVMGLIGDKFVNQAMFCRDPATGARRLYSHDVRVISVSTPSLTSMPCGTPVRICRLDFPAICTDAEVGDSFPEAVDDPDRRFNTSPAIAADLRYAGSGTASVAVTVISK